MVDVMLCNVIWTNNIFKKMFYIICAIEDICIKKWKYENVNYIV